MKCPNCTSSISDSARRCPICSADVAKGARRPESSLPVEKIALIAGLGLGAVLLLWIAGRLMTPKTAAVPPAPVAAPAAPLPPPAEVVTSPQFPSAAPPPTSAPEAAPAPVAGPNVEGPRPVRADGTVVDIPLPAPPQAP